MHQSQSRLYKHYSAHLPISLLFPPVIGRLVALLLLQNFVPPWESQNVRTHCIKQRFPTPGRDPNQGRGGSDVGSREGFMENSIIIKRSPVRYVSEHSARLHGACCKLTAPRKPLINIICESYIIEYD
jgi:hypothetical protein